MSGVTFTVYPLDPDLPSNRYGGRTTLFERAGFLEVGRAGTRRFDLRIAFR